MLMHEYMEVQLAIHQKGQARHAQGHNGMSVSMIQCNAIKEKDMIGQTFE